MSKIRASAAKRMRRFTDDKSKFYVNFSVVGIKKSFLCDPRLCGGYGSK